MTRFVRRATGSANPPEVGGPGSAPLLPAEADGARSPGAHEADDQEDEEACGDAEQPRH